MLPVEQLQTIPLFTQLDHETLAHIAPLFHHARYRLGDIVYKQGDVGDALYVLEAGTLRVRQVDAYGQEQVLGYLKAPAFFGETSLLTGLDRDVTLDVFSAGVKLSVLMKDEFDALLNDFPQARAALAVRPDIQDKLAQHEFPWLTDGEVVLVHTRRHWYVLVARLGVPAAVTGVLVLLAAAAAFWSPLVSGLAGPSGLLALASPLLLALALVWALGAGFWNVLDWSNDYYIVTNKRVVHIEKVIFFFDEREEAPIDQVTNVLEISSGWAARVFGFCDLRVETSGHQVEIHFTFAPRARQIRQHIFEQIDRVRNRAAVEQREQIRNSIRDELWQRLAPDLASTVAADTGDSLPGEGSPEERDGVAGNLVRPGGPPPRAAGGVAPVPLQAVRRRRRTGLGKRINDWFGLRIEEPGRITWRRHWFVLSARMGEPAAALAIVAAVGTLHLSGAVPVRVLGPAIQSWQVQALLGALWAVAIGALGFWLWYRYEDWSNDVYCVTDDRVIDVERSPFGLQERSIETTLDRVQDISFAKRGILANLFNFGDLIIETAGSGRLTFYDVIEPREASDEIFHRRNAFRDRHQQEEVRRERREFIDWFMEYHRFLQQQGEVHAPDAAPPPNSPAPLSSPAEEGGAPEE